MENLINYRMWGQTMKENLSVISTNDSIGKRLKQWRKSQPMTLVEVSKIIGVSQSALSELENDKSLPSAVTLTNLCLYTNIDIYWLLTGKQADGEGGPKSYANDRASGYEPAKQTQDPMLNDLIEILIRVYRSGNRSKIAHLVGFLQGADPGK